jgi:hypothetical protein
MENVLRLRLRADIPSQIKGMDDAEMQEIICDYRDNPVSTTATTMADGGSTISRRGHFELPTRGDGPPPATQ